MDASAKWSHSLIFRPLGRCGEGGPSGKGVFDDLGSPGEGDPFARKHAARTPAGKASLVLFAIWLLCRVWTADAADIRTQNFIVMAPSPQLAQQVGQAAEAYRRDLAVYWLGGELPPWPAPCPIRVNAGHHLAAQGVTTYNRSPVRDFQMEVIGSPERILDSVLPHEVTHTILATYFGQPLPRWADEGICTTVEHVSEREKHETKLREFLSTRRGISMNKLFLMTEYPQDVLPMYAQGYSVCQFLIAQKGPRAFVSFLGDYFRNPSWTANVRQHYGYDSLAELQQLWLAWVAQGNGPIDAFVKAPTRQGDVALVAATQAPAAAPVPTARAGSAQAPINALAIASAQPRSAGPSVAVGPSASESGWYSRLKQGAAKVVDQQAGIPVASTASLRGTSAPTAAPFGIASAPVTTTATSSSPPSLRDGWAASPSAGTDSGPTRGGLYSVSQPQPEQGSVGSRGHFQGQTFGTPQGQNWGSPPGSAGNSPPAATTRPGPNPTARQGAGQGADPAAGPQTSTGSSQGDYRPGSVASPGVYLR